MTTPNNTLLERCTVTLGDAITAVDYPSYTMRARRAGVAAVFHQLAAEIAVMLERNPNLTPHQLITILRMEAAGELAGWEQETLLEVTREPDQATLLNLEEL